MSSLSKSCSLANCFAIALPAYIKSAQVTKMSKSSNIRNSIGVRDPLVGDLAGASLNNSLSLLACSSLGGEVHICSVEGGKGKAGVCHKR